MQRFISMFEHTPPVKAESASTRHGSHEDLKLTRAELELRKCLGNNTQEPLIKSYSCAWQKEILLQGHLHVTPNWFCFYSNILGWETKTCISCQDVTAVEKHKAARVFPTAVVIATGDKKYRFVSFVHRNRSYQVISVVWQNSLSEHPLSTEELVQHLKDIKDKKERNKNASPLLVPRSLNLGSKHNVSDYTADSSDPEQHIPSSDPSSPYSSFSPILGRLDDHETTTTTPSPPTEQLGTTTTQESNSTSSTRSTPHSQTDGTETIFLQDSSASSSHVETDSDTASQSSDSTAEEKEVFPTNCTRSASLIVLQYESETGEEGKTSAKGLPGGSWDDASDLTIGRSCLRRLGGCLLHPGESFRKGWNYSSLIAVYQRIRGVGSCLAHTCTLSNVLNLVIALSIVILLISTLSMVCKLSHVEPALQPYLSWQPWCKLCLANEASYSNGNLATEKHVILTKDIFESMINNHPPGHSDVDASSALPNDDDVPF